MGKAASNEQLKTKAAFCNNVAVGLAIAGFAVPFFNFVASDVTFWPFWEKFSSGTLRGVETRTIVGSVLAIVLAYSLSSLFRTRAHKILAKIEDQ
jgi:hypothetical protein